MGPGTTDERGRFAGRVVVLTGGTAGIGRATAERLHHEGATVVVCGRRAEPGRDLVDRLGPERALFVAADVTERADLVRLYHETIEQHGRLDVVVNNAGGVVTAPLAELQPRHWRRAIALNLDAVFDSCQLAIPHLRATAAAGGSPVIVNVASLDAVAADRGFGAYNAAKAGVVNLTRALALELGPEGIRANAVSPGAIDTPLSTPITTNPVARAAFEAAIPLGRHGRAEEIAAAIAFLASDEASFVNGANLVVDGGVTAGTGHPDVTALLGNER